MRAPQAPRVAAFVAPFLMPATVRFVAAAAQIPDVRLGVITTVPAEHVPPELARHLAAHWRVDDPLDPHQIIEATRGLSGQIGRVERLVGALEQLQVPLAYAREALGIPGMDVETAFNVRDKSRMKQVLRAAGVPCARHQLVTDPADALAFADAVGFPLVAKPPAGAGAQATYRLDDAGASARGGVAASQLRTPRACSRSSWSATSTRSTASRSVDAPSGRRSRTTCRPRWTCCATPGSSGPCCCRASWTTRATRGSPTSDPRRSARSVCATA
jgi:hypothetical protein